MVSRKSSAATRQPTASAPSLPLELAAHYYDTSMLVAVTQTTKACSTSKMIAAQWTGVFSRRFPCLAALPAFAVPLVDAKSLVKGLLTATPPPPEPPHRAGRSRDSLLPSAPRDGEGRYLPLRDTVILAGQLSVRGETALTHRPLLFGHRSMADVADPTDDGQFGEPCWHVELPLEAVGSLLRSGDTKRRIQDALSLPAMVDLDVPSGETDTNVRSLCQDMCQAAETKARQDIFVVAGTDIWRMGALQTCAGSMEGCEGLLEGNFDVPLHDFQNGHFATAGPFVPLEIKFDNMNLAMLMEWNVGAYYGDFYPGDNGVDGDFTMPMEHSTIGRYDLTCHLRAWWEGLLTDNIVDPHAISIVQDDGHSYLCQLLTSTRPVRVRRTR